jgi:Glycosyl transferase family 2
VNVLTITIARDEEQLIPYFVRHYRQYGDVKVYDDSSEDGTADAARAAGAEVLPVEGPAWDHVEWQIIGVKNHNWKPFRDQYDWVIAVDADEFLYHTDLPHVLQDSQDHRITVLEPQGYQMVSDRPPSKGGLITDEIRRGDPCWLYSKRCCFNPQRVTDINFGIGAHFADPKGEVRVLAHPKLKLLHYHFLGLDYVMARYANRVRWQANTQTPEGWRDYKETRQQVQETIADLDAKATEVI